MSDKLNDRLHFLRNNYVELYNSIECIVTSLFENKSRMVSDNYKLTEKIQDYSNRIFEKDEEIKKIKQKLEITDSKYNRALILMASKSSNALKEYIRELTRSEDVTPGTINEFLNKWDVRKSKIEKFDERIARYSDNRYLEGLYLNEENFKLKNELRDLNETVQFLNQKVVSLEKQLREKYRG